MSIYMIFNDKCDEYYIGSTKLELKQRLNIHKNAYKSYIRKGIGNWYTCFNIMSHGMESIHIKALEKNVSSDMLKKRERFYIENLPLCINKNIPGSTPNESAKRWYCNNKERVKEKREENKEAYLEYQKQYRAKQMKLKKKQQKKSQQANVIKNVVINV